MLNCYFDDVLNERIKSNGNIDTLFRYA